MAIGQIIGGIASGLGGLFGDKSSESFSRTSTVDTEADAQDLSPELLKTLESLFQGVVGGGTMQQGTQAVGSRLEQLRGQSQQPSFDVDRFTEDIVSRAASEAGIELDTGINQVSSQAGGSASGNSMAALLSNRLRNETAANIAGTAAEARATGEGIRGAEEERITSGIGDLSSILRDSVLGLVQQTRGASRTGRSKSTEETEGTGSAESGGGPGGFFRGIGGFFGD